MNPLVNRAGHCRRSPELSWKLADRLGRQLIVGVGDGHEVLDQRLIPGVDRKHTLAHRVDVRNAEAVASIKAKAQGHAENLRAIISDMRVQGIASVRKIAEELNSRGILTPRGGRWHATSAARVLERLGA